MSKIKKSDLLKIVQEQADMIERISHAVSLNKQSIIGLEQLKLKNLGQSIFKGLGEQWRFAATDGSGDTYVYDAKPYARGGAYYAVDCGTKHIGDNYDASNWQNSLIERDTAKELLEVDLSSELTGSDLCRAMINRGDKIVLCIVKDYEHEFDTYYDAITHCSRNYFESSLSTWQYAVPINNQGEPLTASEVGL